MSEMQTHWLELSGLRHRVLRWPGPDGVAPWVMLHGWLDLGDSFDGVAQRLAAHLQNGAPLPAEADIRRFQ
mgnify:CR=1 FL=1